MSGTTLVRVFIGGIGLALLLGGVATAVFVGPAAIFGVLWMIVAGVVLLVVAVIEVTRYRSEAAEAGGGDPGPGGGESRPPEPRFRPTNEVFVDATTRQKMRVYADGRTGERRYVAEG